MFISISSDLHLEKMNIPARAHILHDRYYLNIECFAHVSLCCLFKMVFISTSYLHSSHCKYRPDLYNFMWYIKCLWNIKHAFINMFFIRLYSTDQNIGPGGFACAIRGGVCNAFSLFLSSLYVFCFWHTSGKLPRLKTCFPQYFSITRRYMQKNL